MQTSEEIPQSELQRCASELNEAIEAVCHSPAFRTSPKSCEFLRHIVHHTLTGDLAQLKERLIGMTLMGRDASYDTGSDAAVRVRANDVRKRLLVHYTTHHPETGITLDLPSGSYIPRFFRTIIEPQPEQQAIEVPDVSPVHEEDTSPLSLYRLAAPTFAALFLCTICLRWQIAQEHPFTAFWQSVFQNHHVSLYLSPAGENNGQNLVAMQELKAAAPLLNLAGQFHARFALTSTPTSAASSEDVLIAIGSMPGNTVERRDSPVSADELPADGNRITVQNTQAGHEIFDRTASNPRLPITDHAALLTISNGARHFIRIDGTDTAAIETLVEMLCERNAFPASLADSFQDRTITQIVFPMDPHAEAMIFHEPLPELQNRTERTP